ncbi:MAG: hypothetical protein A2735_00595 [Candidatus Yanofskybacteria bacterium RIFCSPHIGHO2_01_FULL_41_21]|uniref:Uncharacterized protein n=1 Tax=Candidatus Yanofskybacteria bacterium RIFCSPHIGHO2_01_FULL_41_21 TaxID=1802660 RepID=A0A1F8EBM1_9BACT|nr:MAG: hypothetical protein A2735_00595 [Candidatus Yanofskybacteria bacterium RIFCSPHIGHO2_01_FULL_41_21]
MDYPKELYLQEALSYIPHILEILDRSPISKTYGCFDREFWHYKAKDFPSGMYEECVLTLALIYTTDFAGNVYFNNSRIKEYVMAGINFAKTSSRSNGSSDDYYPNEEALGATAFSLYACTEAYLLLDIKDNEIETFFKKRAQFIINKKESGILANHHALSALALYNVFLITKDTELKFHAEEKIQEVLSYQSSEGWFQEYEGCDPGYLTFTIDFLAKYLQKNPENVEIKSALEKAVHFCFLTIHPDGSYGGEYGSRNTSHFVPNGFEILARQFPEATYIRNMFLKSLADKTRSRIDDDRIFNHYIYNYLQAFLNHDNNLPNQERPHEYQKLFKHAGLFIRNKNDSFLICSIKKGGVFKLFQKETLITSDCGLILEKQNGKKIISQMWSAEPEFSISNEELVIEANFYNYSQVLPSPFKQLVFRMITLGLGRRFSRIIRVILQKILIVSKSSTATKLERRFSFQHGKVILTDTITTTEKNFTKIYVPTDFTAIYVATGQAFTTSTLMPWQNYSSETETLNKTGKLTIARNF